MTKPILSLVELALAIGAPALIAFLAPRRWRLWAVGLWAVAPLLILLAMAASEIVSGKASPADLDKLVYGLLLIGSFVALPWLMAFHTINSIGFANILPVALALFSRAAPQSVNATMIGVFYLLFFAANLMVGWVGGLYELMPHVSFWLLHAGFCAASTGAIVLLYRPLRAALDPRPA